MTVSFTETFLSRPGRLDEDPADVALACFCDTAAPAFVAAGVLTGNEAEVAHELAERLEPREVAERGDGGRGSDGLKPSRSHQRLDDGGKRPVVESGFHLMFESGGAFMTLVDRVDVLLEDDLLERVSEFYCFESAAVRQRPPGLAGIDLIVAEQECARALATVAFEDFHVLTCSGEISDGLLLLVGNPHGGEIAGSMLPCQAEAITPVSLDAVARISSESATAPQGRSGGRGR